MNDQTKKDKMDGTCGLSRVIKNACIFIILVVKIQGKKPLQSSNHGWEDSIKCIFGK
jgi:hypothetical protein